MKFDWAVDEEMLEVDVHGLTVYEATYELDALLDSAVRLDERVVRVVVGRGSGRLYRGVKEWLLDDGRVERVHDSAALWEIGAVIYCEVV